MHKAKALSPHKRCCFLPHEYLASVNMRATSCIWTWGFCTCLQNPRSISHVLQGKKPQFFSCHRSQQHPLPHPDKDSNSRKREVLVHWSEVYQEKQETCKLGGIHYPKTTFYQADCVSKPLRSDDIQRIRWRTRLFRHVGNPTNPHDRHPHATCVTASTRLQPRSRRPQQARNSNLQDGWAQPRTTPAPSLLGAMAKALPSLPPQIQSAVLKLRPPISGIVKLKLHAFGSGTFTSSSTKTKQKTEKKKNQHLAFKEFPQDSNQLCSPLWLLIYVLQKSTVWGNLFQSH